ncbi:MAG: cell division protein ZapA [Candidatus Glassbacteria bacterium]|nr:cell division protein ZapA [Candidatus Glassbacteria bacterium]
MAEEKGTSTRVTIFGETYNIRSQAEPEYTTRVAEHVNQVMHSIKKNVGLKEPHKIAILAAMSITDELFQEKQTTGLKGEELERRSSALIHLIDNYLERNEA